MTKELTDTDSSARNALGTVALLAASALLFPWADVLAIAAFGIGGVCLAIGLTNEFGHGGSTDPTRCPSCHHETLLRVQGATIRGRIPLLHCRSCGEAYRWWAGTFYRDDGRCQLP